MHPSDERPCPLCGESVAFVVLRDHMAEHRAGKRKTLPLSQVLSNREKHERIAQRAWSDELRAEVLRLVELVFDRGEFYPQRLLDLCLLTLDKLEGREARYAAVSILEDCRNERRTPLSSMYVFLRHLADLDVELDMSMPVWGIPPSPLCERCGHPLCECCPRAWCDRTVETEDEPADDSDTDFPSMCCTDGCDVAFLDWAYWRAQVGEACWIEWPLTQPALGPWFPARLRSNDERVSHAYDE